jgi:hypothetical protein
MSGTLPDWLARWFGMNALPDEGTQWSLQFVWSWPVWLALPAAIVAVVYVATIYWREDGRVSGAYRLLLAAARLALVAIAAIMISQMTLALTPIGLPSAVVLIDDSQSMTVADHYEDKIRKTIVERLKKAKIDDDEPSRWNIGCAALTERDADFLETLAENYKLRVCFLTDVQPAESEDIRDLADEIRAHKPAGTTTALGAALRSILDDTRGAPPAAIILLSDGINTSGDTLSDVAPILQRKGTPLFCIGLGDQSPARNLELSGLEAEDAVAVNNIIHFGCKLTGAGFDGLNATVVLREEDKADVLAHTEITVGPDGQQKQVDLFYQPPRPGVFHFVVEVASQPGESQTKDNQLKRSVRVEQERRKMRVLLAQAYPSYEFRYLFNLLSRDSTVELKTVLQQSDPEPPKWADPVFPVGRDEIFSYDAIILGDLDPSLLGDATLQNVADFVDRPEKGGALVLIAGPKYMPTAYRDTPLARLMPMKNWDHVRVPPADQSLDEGFQVRPTELGWVSPPLQLGNTSRQNREVWQNLPPLYWLLEVPELKPGARVLAEHPSRTGPNGQPLPVLVMQYVGAGKVWLQATDETYRWRWRDGEACFARYWMQLLHYLERSKSRDNESVAVLSTDRGDEPGRAAVYRQGEAVGLHVKFIDDASAPAEDKSVKVVLESAGRPNREIFLDRSAIGRAAFETALSDLPQGEYHAWLSSPVIPDETPSVDFQIVPPAGEFEKLQSDFTGMKAAAAKTGGRFYTFDKTAHLLRDLPAGQRMPLDAPRMVPLWNNPAMLLLFLAILIGEWLFRKRCGLV